MIPLILLVGFLGAGKTTYLRRLLPALRSGGIDAHVIINDYQNARVDAELLHELTAAIRPISGSCVCCGSREELLGALEAITPAPGRVAVIETNGTTDAEELIELLSLEPSLDRFTLPVQLSVLDGQRWQKRFWHNALELEQARPAAFLFVSRLDEIDEKRRAVLEASLTRHHLAAPRVDPEAFAREIAAISLAVRDLPGRGAVAHPGDCACGGHHDEGHHHDHHEPAPDEAHAAHHFSACQIDLPDPVSRASVEAWLAGLPAEILRVKGLARLADSPAEFHVFQRVEDAPVQWLPIGPTARVAHPLAILIGPGIDEPSVRARAAERFAPAPLVNGDLARSLAS